MYWKDLSIEVIKSNRKSVAIEIKKDGSILVRAPRWITRRDVLRFLEEKESWIRKHLQMMQDRVEQQKDIIPLTAEDIRQLADQAMSVISPKVEYYARILQVTYGRITIRNQRTRWGSCSSKGNLNFNCLLMLAPEDVIDYVVVHELCHLLEMNHSTAFWAHVERILPDYKQRRKWLKDHGGNIMKRAFA